MSDSSQSRINYRIPTDLKQRLLDFAEAQGRQVNDVLNELVRKLLETDDKQDPSEVEARHLEEQLRETENRIVKLADIKNLAGLNGDAAYYFAAFLEDAPYVGLKGDWHAIRFKALEDFRSGSAEWVKKWNIQSESQLIEVCRIASDLKELRAKHEELKRHLNVIYKRLSQPQSPAPPGEQDVVTET